MELLAVGLSGGGDPSARHVLVLHRIGQIVFVESEQHHIGLQRRQVSFEQRHFLPRGVAGHRQVHDIDVQVRPSREKLPRELLTERVGVVHAPSERDGVPECDDPKSSRRLGDLNLAASETTRVRGHEPVVNPPLLIRREHVADLGVHAIHDLRLAGRIGRRRKNHASRDLAGGQADHGRRQPNAEVPPQTHLTSTRLPRTAMSSPVP